MGYSGSVYFFKDKKEFKRFKQNHLEPTKVGCFGTSFFNLMSDYFGYSTNGKYLLTYEQLKEVIDMPNNTIKETLEGYLEEMNKNGYSLIYVDGCF